MTRTSCDRVEGGLWGCIVIAAAFFIQVVAFGTSQCIGVYNVEFLQYFDSGAAAVSLVGSINLGMFLGAGPVSSILMTRWSCRQIALVGAVLTNIGMITMPFAPNLLFMYVFYGVISGLGYCLLYVPSHVLSGLYFYKQRSFATGVATAGSGLGASFFPIVFHHLIEYYGWRGSFFIVAGLNLHLFVFAALLRPVPRQLLDSFKAREKSDQRRRSMNGMKGARRETVPMIEVQDDNGGAVTMVMEMADLSCTNGDRHRKTSSTPILSKEERQMDLELNSHDTLPIQNNIADISPNESSACTDVSFTAPMIAKKNKDSVSVRLKKHFTAVLTFDFIVYCFSNVFWNAGGGVLLIFLPKYMTTVGIDKADASAAFTAIGAGACVGCVAGGLIGNIKCIDRIMLYIFGNIGAGLAAILMVWTYFHTFSGMFVLALVYGFMFGIILGLLVVVTSDLLGTEALSDGFGYLMFCNGIGIFAGPPVAGAIIDATGQLDPGLIFSAVVTALGGLIMCVVPVRRQCCSGDKGIHTVAEIEITQQHRPQ